MDTMDTMDIMIEAMVPCIRVIARCVVECNGILGLDLVFVCNVIGCEERHNSPGVCASTYTSIHPYSMMVTPPDSSAGPANIFSVSSAGTAAPYQMTDTNKRLFERIRPSLCAAPQEFYFTGAKGDTVQSWFLPPNGVGGTGGAGGGQRRRRKRWAWR